MALRTILSFCLLYLLALANLFAPTSAAIPAKRFRAPFNRTSFPPSFVFGASSAAYQIEGAALKGGRGPSIWDTFTRQHPEKIFDGSTGDVAVDFYHRYKEDIRMLKELGLKAFRMSISWSGILPYGKVSKGVNPEGIQFYNNVFNELIANALEDEYGGFMSSKIAKDYGDYVDICFKEFGDRVKHWITLNEPLSYSMNGYTKGTFAPGRCSKYVGNCTEGNSGTEPYIVAHNLLLAHATGVKVYREKYQAPEQISSSFNPLEWWKKKQETFPVLSALARDVMNIPMSTVASESAFSQGRQQIGDHRHSLGSNAMNVLVCLRDWIRSERRNKGLVQDGEEEEEIEELLSTHTSAEASPRYGFVDFDQCDPVDPSVNVDELNRMIQDMY